MASTNIPLVQNSFELQGVYIEGSYTVDSILGTKNFEGKDGDVHLSTYPRSGTTWSQNILFGLCYGAEKLEKSQPHEIRANFPYMEFVYNGEPRFKVADKIDKVPRLMKNHLPWHLAPQEIFSKRRKNIVVLRNPKDVALSYFKFYQTEQSLVAFNKARNLPEFLDLFLVGKVSLGSWWTWTKGWVDKVREYPENNLIVHYEEYHENFGMAAQKLIRFMGLENVSEFDIEEIQRITQFETMKTRYLSEEPNNKDFVNQGKMHAWKTKFPAEYVEKFDNMTLTTFGSDEIVEKFL